MKMIEDISHITKKLSWSRGDLYSFPFSCSHRRRKYKHSTSFLSLVIHSPIKCTRKHVRIEISCLVVSIELVHERWKLPFSSAPSSPCTYLIFTAMLLASVDSRLILSRLSSGLIDSQSQAYSFAKARTNYRAKAKKLNSRAKKPPCSPGNALALADQRQDDLPGKCVFFPLNRCVNNPDMPGLCPSCSASYAIAFSKRLSAAGFADSILGMKMSVICRYKTA